MKKVLLFGAGKSATCLIDYLIENAAAENWQVTIADINTEIIEAKTNKAACTLAVAVDIHDEAQRSTLIDHADIVISLMPPTLHFLVAQSCVELGKNLLTASYVDDRLRALEPVIKSKGLLFLCEMGLDPGIDHMSAMNIINTIKQNGGTITSFKSHCGGLVAPESDDNPWHYKISWNPRNIVMAGNAGAVYKVWDEEETADYADIFNDCNEIAVENLGSLAWYPNRDSLSYIPLYKLEEAATFLRTTLRHPSFCRGWNEMVQLKLTDDTDGEIISGCTTIEAWLHTKIKIALPTASNWNEYAVAAIDEEYRSEITNMINWLGLLGTDTLPENSTSSSLILQGILEKKLVLNPTDKDMVVMVHEIEYALNDDESALTSTLVVKGANSLRTAMAKTVGLPLGIATSLILNNTIQLKGLHIPTVPEIYLPVLKALEQHGIGFIETTTPLL